MQRHILLQMLVFLGLVALPLAACDDSASTDTDAISVDSSGDSDGRADIDAPDVDADTDVSSDTPDMSPDAPDVPLDVPDLDIPDPPDMGACRALQYLGTSAERLTSMESIAPNADRSFRVRIDYSLQGCDRRAMPLVNIDRATRVVDIQLYIFREVGIDCPAVEVPDHRVVTLQLEAGSWTIRTNGPSTTLEIPVDVLPETDRICGLPPGVNCEKNCDCTGRGELCLSGAGLGGPFTECTTPCEDNMDCTDSVCVSLDDGLDQTCRSSGNTCQDCPDGFVCDPAGGSDCVADYTLSSQNRVPCGCDADCEGPLRCVHPNTLNGHGVCEYPCETEGNWCAPGHVCGTDAANISHVPSVCGWLGE